MAIKEDFSDVIADADKRNRSWREKLDWVNTVLDNEKNSPDTDHLAYLAIYLRFIATGRVFTVEDGRHFRPSHHAVITQRIDSSLAIITSSAGPANAFIIRKLYPYLPSYDNTFLRAEPLTKIRDIAHRNDIPRDLKDEIKHTLQNKLHRCAGPEDLATSEAILRKITSPGANFSHSFVEAFKVFHEELKEFFNALSVDERLEAMIKKSGKEDVDLISKFLYVKNTGDLSIGHEIEELEILTTLRERFISRSEKGSMAQELRLADIGLEDFAFMLLSSLLNQFGTELLQPQVLRALSLTVANLRLSGIGVEECGAIESGIDALQPLPEPSNREYLLLLKAELDRCLRLSGEYTDTVLTIFPARVETLGRKLGVAEDAIKFFSEGDIRGNLVFQLSKLASGMLRQIRSLASLPPWNILVTGKVSSRLIYANSMDEAVSAPDERAIVLLEHVEGDEEISGSVAGIILAHELPLLSHLGVRARQGRVAFAVCEDRDTFDGFKKLVGGRVFLEVTQDAVRLEKSSETAGHEMPRELHKTINVPDIIISYGPVILELSQVNISNGGGKANAARMLEEFAHAPESGFMTPPGVVVPFGIAEGLIHANQHAEDEFSALINKLNGLSAPDFDAALNRLRDLIGHLTIQDEIINGVEKKFGQDKGLVVRSSANCEDLEEMAGAGLYDSVANVKPSDIADALLKVWSSLWTKRAVLSRKQAGIPHDKAHMAVLIQQIVVPEYSFIMHTINPLNRDPDEVYVELAVGLGETLASGSERGSPYRMVCNKKTGDAKMLSFANFSKAVWPGESGGTLRKTVNYSNTGLSADPQLRKNLGARLSSIGRFVQDSFGMPQDVEGVITDDKIFIVQARPQQGLGS